MKILLILISVILNSEVLMAMEVKREPGKNGIYIIDGDTPVYNLDLLESIKTPKSHDKLIINTLKGNVLDLWSSELALDLTYCISDEFKDKKEDVIHAMSLATQAWMDHANIVFRYIPEQDYNCDEYNEVVTFDIRKVDYGMYLARAFFPSTPRLQRNIMIDTSSFKYGQDAFIGFIKHELGHTLGFRHEHIHTNAKNNCQEDENFKSVTTYDSSSIMHYPQCGGTNNILNLELTDLDKLGAELAYPFK